MNDYPIVTLYVLHEDRPNAAPLFVTRSYKAAHTKKRQCKCRTSFKLKVTGFLNQNFVYDSLGGRND